MKNLLMGCMLMLSGCTSLGVQAPISSPTPIRNLGDDNLIAALQAGYRTCFGTSKICTEGDIEDFLGAGLTLSDRYCDTFFRGAANSSRRRRYGRGLFNDAGGGIQAILGLAKVTTGVITGVGTSVAFADSTFRNYDESFVVDADIARLRRLVLAAQDNMRRDVYSDSNKTKSIYAAESRIIRYAGLCTFLGMKSLLDESLTLKTNAIESENPVAPNAVANPANGQNRPPQQGLTPQSVAPLQTKLSVAPPPPPQQ